MIFSFVFPISGTEWKDKESGTKVVQGIKRVHFKYTCKTLLFLIVIQIMMEIFISLLSFFPAWFSHLIASFLGTSVIGHGIMAGNVAH
jgi:hypothetical protein